MHLKPQGDFALQHASWMVPPQFKPAEVARMEWSTVAAGPPWAVDAWGLGCMMQVRAGCTCDCVCCVWCRWVQREGCMVKNCQAACCWRHSLAGR